MQSTPLKMYPAVKMKTLLTQRINLLRQVHKAINGGPPLNWNVGDTTAYTAQLKRLGLYVLTKGQARAQGYDVPEDIEPIGLGRYGPPINQAIDIYIFELAGLSANLTNPPEVLESPEPVRIRVLPDGRLDTTNAALYCKLSSKTMAMMRSKGDGPKFVKMGRVFYFKEDLDEWLENRGYIVDKAVQPIPRRIDQVRGVKLTPTVTEEGGQALAATKKQTQTAARKKTAAKKTAAKKTPAKKQAAKKAPAKKVEVKLLDTPEAADYCGKTVKAMQMMRYQRTGPAYERNGNRVIYKSTDLDLWLTQAS